MEENKPKLLGQLASTAICGNDTTSSCLYASALAIGYAEIDIEFVAVQGKFSPELIDSLSEQWSIPTNLMFIGSPTGDLPYRLGDLRGVRMII